MAPDYKAQDQAEELRGRSEQLLAQKSKGGFPGRSNSPSWTADKAAAAARSGPAIFSRFSRQSGFSAAPLQVRLAVVGTVLSGLACWQHMGGATLLHCACALGCAAKCGNAAAPCQGMLRQSVLLQDTEPAAAVRSAGGNGAAVLLNCSLSMCTERCLHVHAVCRFCVAGLLHAPRFC